MEKKVLVVDDDESILDAVSLVLEEADYEVETTLKGDETYQKAISFQPDLILLDVLMSGNDGRHICQRLKSHPQTKHIPVVMISAHPSAEEGAIECGANDFLSKPFSTQQLLQLIVKYIADPEKHRVKKSTG